MSYANLVRIEELNGYTPDVISVPGYTSNPYHTDRSPSAQLLSAYGKEHDYQKKIGVNSNVLRLSVPSVVAAIATAELYKKTLHKPTIIISGEQYNNGTSTAAGMEEVMIGCGVPQKHIRTLGSGHSMAAKVHRFTNYQRVAQPPEQTQAIVGFKHSLRSRVGALAGAAGLRADMISIDDILRFTSAPDRLKIAAYQYDKQMKQYELRASERLTRQLRWGGFMAAVAADGLRTLIRGKWMISTQETDDAGRPYNFELEHTR